MRPFSHTDNRFGNFLQRMYLRKSLVDCEIPRIRIKYSQKNSLSIKGGLFTVRSLKLATKLKVHKER